MKKAVAFVVLTVVAFSYLTANAMEEDSLNRKQQKIVTIAANTAVGNLEQLRQELNAGLDAGLTVNEIKEVLVHTYAYWISPCNKRTANVYGGA